MRAKPRLPRACSKYGADMGRVARMGDCRDWGGKCPNPRKLPEHRPGRTMTGDLIRCDTCGTLIQPNAPKLHLQRMRIDSGGYDEGGAYWGTACERGVMYVAFNDAGDVDVYVRARNRDDAKRQVLDRLPRARFYR
jgi:hypothetical protein